MENIRFLKKAGLLKGEISIGNGNFGFLDIPGEESIFISGNCLNTAMHNDTVLVRILKIITFPQEKREGEVYKVIKRDRDVLVGTFENNMSFGFVRPRNSPKRYIYS